MLRAVLEKTWDRTGPFLTKGQGSKIRNEMHVSTPNTYLFTKELVKLKWNCGALSLIKAYFINLFLINLSYQDCLKDGKKF